MKPKLDTTPALYIGLDVHKEKTSVAVANSGPEGEIRSHGDVAPEEQLHPHQGTIPARATPK